MIVKLSPFELAILQTALESYDPPTHEATVAAAEMYQCFRNAD